MDAETYEKCRLVANNKRNDIQFSINYAKAEIK